MQQQNLNYYCPQDELDEELTINFKKIFFALWNRKTLIVKVFISVLAFFILMTFSSAKKYTVDTDLYINKSNNSNMAEVNPFVIEDLNGGISLGASNTFINNEIEIMKSPLVIDKVIQENNIRIGKLYGKFKTKKYGQYVKADKFVKAITIENKKGTNVVSISFKSKDKDLAYGVINSIIKNYIVLHQELNTDKSKSDKKIIETEYKKAKADLDKKMNSVRGLPQSAMAGAGNLAAMSAFSNSAQKAISNLQGQFIAGERSKMELTEDAERVSELAKKLQWAKLVDSMSDSSNVVILKEPRRLQDYEQTSPKLFTNILLGIVFGVIAALMAIILAENVDKKLTYSMLGDNIIYNFEKDFIDLKSILLAEKNPISLVVFEKLEENFINELSKFKNINFVKADISEEFENGVQNSSKVIMLLSVGKTNSKEYKRIKEFLDKLNKEILVEVLV